MKTACSKLLWFFVSIIVLTCIATGRANAQVARQGIQASPTPPGAQPEVALVPDRPGQGLQQFACELYGADKSKMQEMALEQLPRIGGWYSIQFYRELLSPRALILYRKAPTKPENRDKPAKEPIWWALIGLPKVAPNPPPIEPPDSNFDSAKIQHNAQIWRDWIQANQATLKTLQPTGEAVDFSGRQCSQRFRTRISSRHTR